MSLRVFQNRIFEDDMFLLCRTETVELMLNGKVDHRRFFSVA